MNLEHSFTVQVGIDEAWKILLDIELIGPCMPGAAIDSVDGDEFTGTVKVKLGPIGLTYKGKAGFVEKDEAAHRAVIDARGRDARGNGTARAKVTATLSESGGSTTVQVDTDLDITGKPAQFGRGVMVDVGNKLIGQFADNLAGIISAGAHPAEAAGPSDDGVAESAADAAASVEPIEPGAPAAGAKPARKRSPRPKPAEQGESAAAPEIASEDAARDEGSTGGPIEQAALAAVAGGPGGFGSPGVDAVASVNGTSSAGAAGSTSRVVPPRQVEPINLIESAGPAVAKRLAPVVGAAALVALFVWRRRH